MTKRPEEAFFDGLQGLLGQEEVQPEPFVEDPMDPDDMEDLEHPESEDDLEERRRSIAEEDAEEEAALEKVAQQSLRTVTRSNLFSHPEAHPYVLDLVLIKEFQLDWLKWEADTLFSEIEKTFRTSIADVNRHKILVAMTIQVSDMFWDRWEVFENAILALNGIVPRIDMLQPPDISLLMAGVDIANSLRQEEYSEEVARYCAACFLGDHVSYSPAPLDFCQPYLSDPKFRCGECKQVGSALPPFNGHCPSCSRTYEDHPFNFKPAEGAKDDPSKLSFFNSLDPEPTKKRYDELLDMPPSEVHIEEVPDDIEAARLITATDYMNFRRQQRDRQLSEIRDWMGVS